MLLIRIKWRAWGISVLLMLLLEDFVTKAQWTNTMYFYVWCACLNKRLCFNLFLENFVYITGVWNRLQGRTIWFMIFVVNKAKTHFTYLICSDSCLVTLLNQSIPKRFCEHNEGGSTVKALSRKHITWSSVILRIERPRGGTKAVKMMVRNQ